MKLSKIVKMAVLSMGLIAGLSACTQAPIKQVSVNCSGVSDKNLQQAINNAQNTLSQRSCQYEFDSLHQQLLDIAQNDPAKENGNKFFQFYKWSVNEGVVSSKQGKVFYNRYFQPTFGNVLPNDQNVCSLRGHENALVKNLNTELSYKKLGLQDIMQNRDAYFEAQRIHNELVFLIETTLMACENA